MPRSSEENESVDVRCGDWMVFAQASTTVAPEADKKPKAHHRPSAIPDFHERARNAAAKETPIEKLMASRKAALFIELGQWKLPRFLTHLSFG
ncbi:hypothetical protein Acid7E03_44200 [Acidisoma sp. 7E03]